MKIQTVKLREAHEVTANGFPSFCSILWDQPAQHLVTASSSDVSFSIHDLLFPSGAPKILRHHRYGVTALALSPNSTCLASGSVDHSVKLYKFPGGEFETNITRFTLPIRTVAFNKSGSTLAAAGDDEGIKLINTVDGSIARVLKGHKGSVSGLAFDPKGEYLASIDSTGTVIYWELHSGRIIHNLKGIAPDNGADVSTMNVLCWSPDGETLAVPGLRNDVVMYDRDTAEKVFSLRGDHIQPICFLSWSPNGRYMATSSLDRQVLIWDVNGKQDIDRHKFDERICCMAWKPIGNALAVIDVKGRYGIWESVIPSSMKSPTEDAPMQSKNSNGLPFFDEEDPDPGASGSSSDLGEDSNGESEPPGRKTPHVLVIPFPAQGHMIPILDLTHKLASNGGVTITIFTTPKNVNLLEPLLSVHSSVKTLILPFPSHPSIPAGIENVKDMPNSTRLMMLALPLLQDSLFNWFRSHPSPPQFIISDMFCGWTQHFAARMGIPRLVFSPSSAFALSTMFFLWREVPKRDNHDDQNEVVVYDKVVNSPKYPWWQVSGLFRSYVEGQPESEQLRALFLCNEASGGVVVNSFTDLERPYLKHLCKYLGHDRVWAVGPLLPPNDDFSLRAQRGGSSSVSIQELVSWLDKRKDRKVVYVCFGSQIILSKKQTEQIALALVKSGVHFIWPVKEDNVKDNDGVIIHGFEDRTADRGLVIRGWAPQVVILRHPAVGVFFSHCGWNSVIEAVMAGVPLLAWPMAADQYVNASLLVDELKVAKRVCEGAETVPNSDQLASVLAESVSSGGAEMRQSLKLKAAALDAIREGGTSKKDLRCIIDNLVKLAL